MGCPLMGWSVFSANRTSRRCLLPFACTLHNRNVAIDREIRKALYSATGLWPTHLQPRDFGLLSCPQHDARVMRGEKASAAHLDPASLQIAGPVGNAGTDRVRI